MSSRVSPAASPPLQQQQQRNSPFRLEGGLGLEQQAAESGIGIGGGAEGSASNGSSSFAWSDSLDNNGLLSNTVSTLQRISFSVLSQPISPLFSLFVVLLELLQIAMVPLSAIVGRHPDWASVTETSVVGNQTVVSAKIAVGPFISRVLWDVTADPAMLGYQEDVIAVCIVLGALGLIPVVLYLFEAIHLRRGGLSIKYIETAIHYFSPLSRLMVMPSIAYTITVLRCSNGAAAISMDDSCFNLSPAVRYSQAIIQLAIVMVVCAYNLLLHTDFVPSLGHLWAQSNIRISMLLFFIKIAITLFALLETTLPGLRSFLTLAGIGFIAFMYWYFIPFYSNKANLIYTCGLAGATSLSLMAFISSLATDSLPQDVLTWVAIAIVPFACIVGGVLMVLRLRLFKKKLIHNAASVKHPFELHLLLMPLYNEGASPSPGMPNRQIVEGLAGRFFEKMPMSPFVHAAFGVYALEKCHDPRTLIIHARLAKRLEVYPDLKYQLSSYIQFAHDLLQEESGGKKDVETMLEAAAHNHKYAKLAASKFWAEYSRSKAELDSPHLLSLLRTFEMHDAKCFGTLSGLLERYPTNPRILRQYARFMQEIRSDNETAQQALILADQYEEDSHRVAQKRRKSVKITVVDDGRPRKEEDDADPMKVPTSGRKVKEESDTSETKSQASSIESSASSASQSAEAQRGRVVRKRLERTRSTVVQRIHGAFFITLALIVTCIIAEFGAVYSTLDKYLTNLQVISGNIGSRATLYYGLFYLRQREMATSDTGCPSILNVAKLFNTELNSMFKESKASPTINSLWAQTTIDQYWYSQGDNTTDLEDGTFFTTHQALWDIGLSSVAALGAVCNPTLDSYDYTGLRTDPNFRMLFQTVPYEFSDKLQQLGGLFSQLLLDNISIVNSVSYGLFFSRLGIAVLACLGLLILLHTVKLERKNTSKMFQGLNKAVIANIQERLGVSDDKDMSYISSYESSRRLSTVILGSLQVFASIFLLCGIGAAVFGLTQQFIGKYRTTGNYLDAAGERVTLLGSTMFWAQEYAIKDVSLYQLNTTHARLQRDLDRMIFLDQELKYSNESAGIYSYIRTDKSKYDIWYDRPCPAELNLTECTGLAQLLRYYLDEQIIFASLPPNLATEDNPDYLQAKMAQVWISKWFQEGITSIFTDVSSANQQTMKGLGGCLAAAMAGAFIVYLLMLYTMNRLSVETTTMMKMLLFIPPEELDKVPAIKDFLDSDQDLKDINSAKESTNNSSISTEQQETKNLLDGCEDAVIIVGPLGIIELFNPSAERLTGYSAADILGHPISTLLPSGIGRNSKLLSHLMNNNVSDANEFKQSKKAKELTIRSKGGRNIQSLVSTARCAVRGRTTTALFIRDISDIKSNEEKLLQQRKLAEQFLCNILPKSLVKQLAQKEVGGESTVIVQTFEEVTVLFADIVQFTNMSSGMAPEKLVQLLSSLVSEWDKSAMELGVEKIKTIGDCYMACAGVPEAFADHAIVAMEFAVSMLDALDKYNKQHGTSISIRIGMNTGRVIAGVLGLHKMAYDLWGETVATAERMESAGFPNRIHVSAATYAKLKGHGWSFESRGFVKVKGHEDCEGFLFVKDEFGDLPVPQASSIEPIKNANVLRGTKSFESTATSSLSELASALRQSEGTETPHTAKALSALGTEVSEPPTMRSAAALSPVAASNNSIASLSGALRPQRQKRRGPTALLAGNDSFRLPISESINSLYTTSSTAENAL